MDAKYMYYILFLARRSELRRQKTSLIQNFMFSRLADDRLICFLPMNSSLLVLQYCYSFVFVGKTSITEDARHTQKAIDEFRKSNPRFVKQIVVVLHEKRMLKDFKIALFKNNYATTSIVSSPFPLLNDHSPSPLPSPTTPLMLRRNETDPTSTLLPNQGNKIAVNVIERNIS